MSVGFYKNFFDGLCRIYEPERLAAIDKKLPIYILAGDKDPVGKMGKLVGKLADMYIGLGIEDVKIKLYEDARHEIVNELNKDEVYADVSGWLDNLVENSKAGSSDSEVVADAIESAKEKEPELALAN